MLREIKSTDFDWINRMLIESNQAFLNNLKHEPDSSASFFRAYSFATLSTYSTVPGHSVFSFPATFPQLSA